METMDQSERKASESSETNDTGNGNGDPTTTANTTSSQQPEPSSSDHDPLCNLSPPDNVRLGDHVLLVFADGRHVFARAEFAKTAGGTVKINKRTYPTRGLIGLPYGTLLEVERTNFKVLPPTETILPSVDELLVDSTEGGGGDLMEKEEQDSSDTANEKKPPAKSEPRVPDLNQARDNRNLLDNNTSQTLQQSDLMEMRQTAAGKDIVQELISNSKTFQNKTDFSKQKYIAKKQLKYQPRCRLVRCISSTIAQAMYIKDSKKMGNLRPDTLGQILAYANITAGGRVLCWEDVMGLVTGSIAERLGGYGHVYSIYTGQQPCSIDLLEKFNFSFALQQCIQWVHVGDVLNWDEAVKEDVEAADRNEIEWPCPLQCHTREYLKTSLNDEKKQQTFLDKRAMRFTRKMTRPSPLESVQALRVMPVDSLVLVVRNYDVTDTLAQCLPFLAPSSPFCVFCEYLEPLVQAFTHLQNEGLAINLKLITAWAREYQVLPNRTHPEMTMTQNGGFLLTGIKLDEVHGKNEIPESTLAEIRARLPTRRGKKRKPEDAKEDQNGGKEAKESSSPTSRGDINTQSNEEGKHQSLSSTPPSRSPELEQKTCHEEAASLTCVHRRSAPRKSQTPQKRPVREPEEEDEEDEDREDVEEQYPESGRNRPRLTESTILNPDLHNFYSKKRKKNPKPVKLD